VYLTTALLAPHAWFFGSALFWNTRAAGRAAMLFDALLNGVVVALYGSSPTILGPFVVVTLSNAISVGGLPFMLEAGVTMAIAALGSIHALPSEFEAGRLTSAGELGIAFFLAFYMCLSAVSMRSQARRITSTNTAIQRFVPREFLQALGHDDVRTAKLGDVTAKSIAMLFADIRNFTASSEGMTPEETFAFLNRCLSKLGPHVRAQRGFVDKYIGDAVMALFPHDPSDAVRAAIAMQEEIRRSNASLAGGMPVAIGIGIHVGRVMMGTIGEAERFEATVISDAVNLTARLESLTKQLGCDVLVSEEIYATLDEPLRRHARRLGTFIVKGKARPVALYEVFASDPDALREWKLRSQERFESMLAAFAEERLEAAIAIASELRDACPDDGPANWWFLRLMKESGAFDDAGHSTCGIVRLDEK
jgi:class 3 adenylate cyclase